VEQIVHKNLRGFTSELGISIKKGAWMSMLKKHYNSTFDERCEKKTSVLLWEYMKP
jgi:hypothetical protein